MSVLSGFLFLKTGLSGFVVCILWSSFLFCCFVLNFVFCFFIPLKKDPQKTGHSKKPKKQKCRKKRTKKNQLAQLCSQIVFLFFWGVGFKNADFAENTIKIVVSAYFEK